MPVINIEYDAGKITDGEVLQSSNAVQRIVSEITHIEDVFVYANSAHIKVKIAPIEIFVYMSAHKIVDVEKLIQEIKSKISEWKKADKFPHLINLTLAPMDWKIEIGI